MAANLQPYSALAETTKPTQQTVWSLAMRHKKSVYNDYAIIGYDPQTAFDSRVLFLAKVSEKESGYAALPSARQQWRRASVREAKFVTRILR